MKQMIDIIKSRTDQQLINDWVELDKKEMSQEVATIRGLYMDELEVRYPDEFDEWLDGCEQDYDITSYIKL